MNQIFPSPTLHTWPVKSPFEDLTTLRIFAQTVELRNFSEVARRMDVSPAMVSKRIAALEARLEQRLLNRNTRELFVTEAGQRLYEHCLRALGELDQAAAEISNLHETPAGHLRVTAPSLLGEKFIGPHISAFLKQYPSLSLDFSFSTQKLDLFQQRIDVAVRIADVLEPGLVAIKLAPYQRVFCAAPAFLKKHGIPAHPNELMQFNCLISRGSTPNNHWPVKDGDEISHVPVAGNFSCDTATVVRSAALDGLGIMMAPRWLVAEHLASGTLVELLSDYTPHNRAIYAVLLQRSDSSRRLTAVVEFLKQCFAHL